jgi:valyl-tRNA synthetase
MSPFTPFISEYIYLQICKLESNNLTNLTSIHYLDYPQVISFNQQILQDFAKVHNVIELSRQIRVENKIRSNKFLTESVSYYSSNLDYLNILRRLEQYILPQIYTSKINYYNYDKFVKKTAFPNQKSFGKRSGKLRSSLIEIIKNLTTSQINTLVVENNLLVLVDNVEFNLIPDDIIISQSLDVSTNNIKSKFNEILVETDITISLENYELGIVREFISVIQQYRRTNSIKPGQTKNIIFHIEDDNLLSIVLKYKNLLDNTLKTYQFSDLALENSAIINMSSLVGCENNNVLFTYSVVI